MSVEEEVELRDMVAQTLELNGCLPKIKAQLRANLFLALDEDSKISKQQPLMNTKIKTVLEDPDAQLMFSLVREFLDYFDLDFTASVYEPESHLGSLYKYEGRQKISEELGLKAKDGPLLLHLVKIAQTKSNMLKINLTNINGDQKASNSSTVESSDYNQINGHSENPNKQIDNLNESYIKENGENIEQKALDVTYLKKDLENDDTFNGTSSIEEDAMNGDDNSHKSIKNDEASVVSPEQESSPESKSRSEEKKSKSDKLKTKLELPPLQLNKGRGSDLLPSLYKKSNREYDFEIKEDYEEDFSELELSHSKIDSPKPLFEEIQCSEHTSNGNSVSSKKKNSFYLHSHSNSDNKLLNSNSTENIETNLSVDGSTPSKTISENT